MGCDIHVHIEMQASDGTWHRAEDIIQNPYYEPGETYHGNTPETYDSWYWSRNYALFSILAGVRGNGPPIVEPRGLPDDAGQSVLEEWDEGGMSVDWHTPHWYSLKELEDNIDRFKDAEVYGQQFIDDVIVRMRTLADEELDGDGEKIRFVAWFDN